MKKNIYEQEKPFFIGLFIYMGFELVILFIPIMEIKGIFLALFWIAALGSLFAVMFFIPLDFDSSLVKELKKYDNWLELKRMVITGKYTFRKIPEIGKLQGYFRKNGIKDEKIEKIIREYEKDFLRTLIFAGTQIAYLFLITGFQYKYFPSLMNIWD